VRFVSRAQWGARRPRSRTGLRPDFGSTIHYNGPPIGLGRLIPNHAACSSTWRQIQNFHMDGRGWSDIAYTCGVCPHGYVFEGRGVGVRTAANGTNEGNASAYAVFMFYGDGETPTAEMYAGTSDAVEWLRDNGAPDGVNGHRDWKPTACPGDPAYTWLRSGAPAPDGELSMAQVDEITRNQWNSALYMAAEFDAAEQREHITQRFLTLLARHEGYSDPQIRAATGKGKLPPDTAPLPAFDQRQRAVVAFAAAHGVTFDDGNAVLPPVAA